MFLSCAIPQHVGQHGLLVFPSSPHLGPFLSYSLVSNEAYQYLYCMKTDLCNLDDYSYHTCLYNAVIILNFIFIISK